MSVSVRRLPSEISRPLAPSNLPQVQKPINEIIGKGYGQFWRFKGRYRVVKGGRASKKSTTSALWFIYNMMKLYHEQGLKPNTLVIRRYFYTHKQSTYTQLKWAMNQLGVAHLWKCTVSPMEMTYKPSGQKILFRGMDDPMSITSITVDEGHLCWTWWEEAYQIGDEDAFDKIDMSIRGELPDGLFKQHTIVMNPWSEKIWIKQRFFDKVGATGLSDNEDILAITRNYDCNEFLGLDDISLFETMREENPRRFNIEGMGNWGIADGLIYNKIREADFDPQEIYDMRDTYGKRVHRLHLGLDFGFTNDPTAFIAMLVDAKNYRIYVIDEIYQKGMTNKQIYNAIHEHGWSNDLIVADSADPRTINELKMLGLNRIRPVKKKKGEGGKNFIISGINVLQDYEIIVHPSCSNFMVEAVNYVYEKDRETGKSTNTPIDDFNHLMDAMRYGGADLKSRNFIVGGSSHA